MADDWIPWSVGLPGKGEVVAMARRLSDALVDAGASSGVIHRRAVAATLMEIWTSARAVSTDGIVRGWSLDYLDELSGVRGFGQAMESAGWVAQTRDGIRFTRWETWNSNGAKARLQRQRRQAKWRDARVDGAASPERLPEKSREEKREKKQKKKEGGETELAWSVEAGWNGITDADRDSWKSAYPACDLDRQLAAMGEWLKANPEKARKSNWRRFVTNWLSKSQDRGGDAPAKPYRPLAGTRGTVPNHDRLKGQFPEEVIRVPIS